RPAPAHCSTRDVNAGRRCDGHNDHDAHATPPTETVKQGDGAVNEGDKRRTDWPSSIPVDMIGAKVDPRIPSERPDEGEIHRTNRKTEKGHFGGRPPCAAMD